MKFLNKISIILLLTGFSLTAFGQKVGSDRNLNVDISEYETFTWSSHAENNLSMYFLEDAVLKATVREAIKYELEARSYEYQENDQADLLVNFRIFEAPVTVTGYEKTYVDENYWSPMEVRKEFLGIIPRAELRELDEQKMYFLDSGSIIIQLVEIESGDIVWQGYAEKMLNEYEDSEVKSAIQKIFGEEFNFSS